MSLYSEWINRIKALADPGWLTDSQREAYDLILHRWKRSSFVCVWGDSGVGKTFVAWVLAKEYGYSHVNELDCVPNGAKQVILDGPEYFRMMRPVAMELNIQRVILLMHKPPSEAMPKVQIVLTERDVKEFQHNLVRNGIMPSFLTEVQDTDLGQILRNEAIARG